MDEHAAAMAALQAALERFLQAYDDWRTGGAGSADATQALDEARAALEEARRRLAQVEKLRPPL